MLGLDGFRLLGAAEVGGELEVAVETTATRVGCPGCGVVAALHARREVVVRDVDAVRPPQPGALARAGVALSGGGVPAADMDRTVAGDPAAGVADRAGAAGGVPPRRRGRVGGGGRAGPWHGWHTVMRAVVGHGRPLVDDPARIGAVDALGVDETAFLRATRQRSTR